ncbi:Adiponectin receptor protein 2 [Labeo rohita]|uniref:Adiponectin receptor protein 2 n=1 Tax=Labeo rohita TaxID=84645 RepID=A0ABQ8MRT1_LABRO|nr:Adiponectin receptor protein 2 [Labeo rohita]
MADWAPCLFTRRVVHEKEEETTEREEEDDEEEEEDKSSDEGLLLQAHHAMERMEEFVHKIKHMTSAHLTRAECSQLPLYEPANIPAKPDAHLPAPATSHFNLVLRALSFLSALPLGKKPELGVSQSKHSTRSNQCHSGVVFVSLIWQHATKKLQSCFSAVLPQLMWEGRWRVIPHDVLPDWLKDNDFLLHGHRPPMPSFRACFRSIFRIHTETGNIWTHLLGCLFFLCLGIVYMFRPNMSFVAPFQEKIVIGAFFLGAILCLSFSWLFHTVYCHSEGVSRVFSKLDYSGIAFLIMGSFVPWLYYSFYCSPQPCFIYLIVVCILGVAAITVSQCDFFATPQYRGVRAGVFVGLGLSGVVPTLHFMIAEGFLKATTIGQMGWLFLMAVLYITGACLYAARIPERFFPGKCDIWFHSHQLFHILVVAGAFVHFHGVSNLQEFRYTAGGGCAEEGGS